MITMQNDEYMPTMEEIAETLMEDILREVPGMFLKSRDEKDIDS